MTRSLESLVGGKNIDRRQINLGSNCNSAVTSYFAVSSLSILICEMGMIWWTFQSISHLKWRILVNAVNSEWHGVGLQTKPMSFITENRGSQGEKAKRNNHICLLLFKLFKQQFLKKGRKCPPCEWERRKGRRARVGQAAQGPAHGQPCRP